MKRLGIAVLCMLPLLLCCCKNNESTTPPPDAVARVLEGARALPANVDEWYTYRVLVTGADPAPEFVLCRVSKAGSDTLLPFALYDDGGFPQNSTPDYAAGHSGDIAAHNGQYTRRVNSHRLALQYGTGIYTFTFSLHGGPANYRFDGADHFAVQVDSVEDCLLTSVPHDSAFAACFAPVPLEVHVRPSAADNVDSVWVKLVDDGTLDVLGEAKFTASAGDTVWRYTLAPTFFRCVPDLNANATFQYWAHTRFGRECEQEIPIVSFANDTPSVSNLVMPELAYRSSTPDSVNLIAVTVTLHDCELQGVTDFIGDNANPGVKFDSHRDSLDWTHAANFYLQDNGETPDSVAGDGVYSTWLQLPFTADTALYNKLYYFRFYAVDCAPPHLMSLYALDSIRVVQPVPSALQTNMMRAKGRGVDALR
jgi:hypothetical protein